VGHNCELARGVTLINQAQVAGHVEIGEKAILSAGVLVHQFVRIGKLSFAAANARVPTDIPPFMMCHGDGSIVHYNLTGLRRAGLDRASLSEIRGAFKTLYRSGRPFQKSLQELAASIQTASGRELVDFLRAPSKRGIAAGGRHRDRGDAPTDGSAADS
jgi:UDP-N-acetylglucosamine acyltransferase